MATSTTLWGAAGQMLAHRDKIDQISASRPAGGGGGGGGPPRRPRRKLGDLGSEV